MRSDGGRRKMERAKDFDTENERENESERGSVADFRVRLKETDYLFDPLRSEQS